MRLPQYIARSTFIGWSELTGADKLLENGNSYSLDRSSLYCPAKITVVEIRRDEGILIYLIYQLVFEYNNNNKGKRRKLSKKVNLLV